MANKIEIIIEASDKASAQLKDLGKTLDATGKAGETASRGLSGFAKAVIAAGAGAAVLKFGKMAVELGELGAAAQRTEQGFTTISGGSAAAAANLDALMQATDGAIDRTTAMGLANQMMQMGLADSAEALGRNAEMATRLGRAMGVDATTAMQNWNAMMANQSVLRLDTFGISSSKVRARIEEMMAATEGLSREQAFTNAVMEVGAEAMDRLGDSTEDAALQIEQSKAALVDLKSEIGMAFTDAVAGGEGALGKFTRAWGDNLRAMRQSGDEIGWLEGNVGMLRDALGATNTVFDKFREAEELNLHAAASGAAALAQGFSDVGASAPTAEQGVSGVGEAAAIAEEELADAASAALDFASGIDSISTAAFAQAAIESLGESILAAGGSTMEAVAAQRALLTELGLLTPAKEAASAAITTWGQLLADHKIDVDTYAMAVANLKGNIDALEGKEIEIKTIYVEEHRAVGGGGGTSYRESGNYEALGGDYYVDRPTTFIAGDAGGERAIFIPKGKPGYDADLGTLLSGLAAPLPASGAGVTVAADGGTRIGAVNLTVNGTSDARETARLVMREFQDRGFIPRIPLR